MKSNRALIGLATLATLSAMLPTVRGDEGKPAVSLQAVPIGKVTIDDPFWSPRYDVWRRVTITDCLDKFERDGTLENFDRVARGELHVEHRALPWFDGLLYEMIRASADFMVEHPDPALKRRLDGYIDRIAAAAAADPDGYINTYTTLKEPDHRWGQNGGNDRWQHDLYNNGCLVEAAIHYYRATGETKLLATAVRVANLMSKVMGPSPRQNIIPGHAIPEEAMVRLYELFKAEPGLKQSLGVPVNEDNYLALAKFWVDARGHHEGRPDFGAYDQDEVPALEQKTIEGHAVRAALFGSGMVAVGVASNQPQYVDVATRLWHNMVERRMYITGGVGSFANDEKFGPDYVLPNDGYLETCAAVASSFFSENLTLVHGQAQTVDELERVLYNNALAGVSLAGNSYFYENPLEATAKHKRWDWHSCPCCPPMFLKLMGSLPSYIYSTDGQSGLYVNLFIGSRATTTLAGRAVTITQQTHYPWQGDVNLTVEPEQPSTFDVYVRIPAWTRGGESIGGLYRTARAPADSVRLLVNGQPIESPQLERGYAKLHREWKPGDTIELQMAMPIQRVTADEHVEADRGKVALMRGPLVYCLESPDNGGHVTDLILPDDATIRAEAKPDLLGGITVLMATAQRAGANGQTTPAELVAIPYFANANRGPAELRTWIPRATTTDQQQAPSTTSPTTRPTWMPAS